MRRQSKHKLKMRKRTRGSEREGGKRNRWTNLEDMLSMGTFLELNVCIDRYPRWVSSHDLLRCGKHVLYKCSCPMVGQANVLSLTYT